MSGRTSAAHSVEQPLARWLADHTGVTGPWRLRRLAGGNSNETCLLRGHGATFVLRRPPQHALSASAHSIAREHRVLTALQCRDVPAPAAIAPCEDPDVPLAPFLLMEHVPDAVSLTSELPDTYGRDAQSLTRVADELVDALAAIHQLDWRAAGLETFGRPEGFLERQVQRWYRQWESIARRPLPAMPMLARWLEDNRARTTTHPG